VDSCSKDARKAEAVKPNEVASPASSFPCVVLAHAALFDGSFEQTRRSLDLKIGEVGFDGYG
jgi:hypothetical protein